MRVCRSTVLGPDGAVQIVGHRSQSIKWGNYICGYFSAVGDHVCNPVRGHESRSRRSPLQYVILPEIAHRYYGLEAAPHEAAYAPCLQCKRGRSTASRQLVSHGKLVEERRYMPKKLCLRVQIFRLDRQVSTQSHQSEVFDEVIYNPSRTEAS